MSFKTVSSIVAVSMLLAVGCGDVGSSGGDGGEGQRFADVRQGSGCDPNYSGCVPDVDYDLDCADVDGPLTVLGADPHGFDRDGDGQACEPYNP